MIFRSLEMAGNHNISDSDIPKIKVACIKLSKMLSDFTKILEMVGKTLKSVFYTSKFLDPW